MKGKEREQGSSSAPDRSIVRSRSTPPITPVSTSPPSSSPGITAVSKIKTKHDRDLYSSREGFVNSKQLSETIETFLARLPPSTTKSTDIGNWIWCNNPHDHTTDLASDSARCKTQGLERLARFSALRHKITIENPKLTISGITRKMGLYRQVLEEDLLAIASRTGVISGKWMLFPNVNDVDRIWSTIVTATEEGTLGFCAKVATLNDEDDAKNEKKEQNEKGRLICVYTNDFTDKVEIKRVLDRLRELNVVGDHDHDHSKAKDKKKRSDQVYYKCDAWTILNIKNGNEWRIKASMYGSRDKEFV